MASTPHPTGQSGKARSLSISSKDIAKKFILDEAAISVTESYWKYMPAKKAHKVLITCEHASNRFPQHLKKELELENTHWAIDLGAEDLAARIASDTKLPVLCSRVSRLVVDVNRPVTSDTIFRPLADGNPVLLNAKLSAEEKQDRIDRYWKPYRFELNEILINNPSIELVISVHSFTSNYEGDHRDCEIGILYLDSVKEASWFIKDFEEKGYKVVENEPWPATLCDIAAPVMAAGKQIVILEIRNDLASDPEFRRRIAADIQGLLEKEKLL